MSDPKERGRTKKSKEAEPSVEEEILQALSEFTDSLKKGDVTDRLRNRVVRPELTPVAEANGQAETPPDVGADSPV